MLLKHYKKYVKFNIPQVNYTEADIREAENGSRNNQQFGKMTQQTT